MKIIKEKDKNMNFLENENFEQGLKKLILKL